MGRRTPDPLMPRPRFNLQGLDSEALIRMPTHKTGKFRMIRYNPFHFQDTRTTQPERGRTVVIWGRDNSGGYHLRIKSSRVSLWKPRTQRLLFRRGVSQLNPNSPEAEGCIVPSA